jgi:hypothetical protein
MPADPTSTDPTLYRVVFENDRVRVLEYRDRPGDRTTPTATPTASCSPSAPSAAASTATTAARPTSTSPAAPRPGRHHWVPGARAAS